MHRMLFALLLVAGAVRAQEPQETQDPRTMSAPDVYAAVCARCHGEYGRGNPPEQVLNNFEVAPRDFHDPYFSSRERRRDWFDVIAQGGPARGLNAQMPAFGDQLTAEQIADLVEYLKGFIDQQPLPQGETAFFRAHFVTKAFPEQELLLIPDLQREKDGRGTLTKMTVEYTQRFAQAFQAEVKVPFWNHAVPGDNIAGLGDVELGFKWAAWHSREVPAIASVGFDVGLPTGQKEFGEGAFLVAPWVAAGAGLGNLFQAQVSSKLEAPLATGRTQVLVSAAALTLTLPRSKQGFFPSVELVSEVPLDGAPATLSVVPALYTGITRLGHVAVSVGTELPVVGDRGWDYRIVAFLLWEYSDGGIWW